MDIHSLETKIHQMVDDLQGLCSTVGLSNTANEEVVVTSVFLYKFLNDKFMFSLEEFAKEIDIPVESILRNEDGMLDAFYQYNSKNVAFAYEDTIQYPLVVVLLYLPMLDPALPVCFRWSLCG